MPAYQLTVVVDDARQGVTEIVRGADLLESCARQWLLQEALGYGHPRWWHVPLVTDESGRRLAKRSDDVSLARLRAAGTDPRQVVSWVAGSAGIEAPPQIHAQEIVARFDMEPTPKRSPRHRLGSESLWPLRIRRQDRLRAPRWPESASAKLSWDLHPFRPSGEIGGIYFTRHRRIC